MNKDQLKGRYRQSKIRIRASNDRFFGDPPPENKDRIQSAAGNFQKSQGQKRYGDFGEGPEYDLERQESYREIRKDFQDGREDGS